MEGLWKEESERKRPIGQSWGAGGVPQRWRKPGRGGRGVLQGGWSSYISSSWDMLLFLNSSWSSCTCYHCLQTKLISWIMFVYSSSMALYFEIPEALFWVKYQPQHSRTFSIKPQVLRQWCVLLAERCGVEDRFTPDRSFLSGGQGSFYSPGSLSGTWWTLSKYLLDEWMDWLGVSYPLLRQRLIHSNSPRMRKTSASFLLGPEQSWTGNGPFSFVNRVNNHFLMRQESRPAYALILTC